MLAGVRSDACMSIYASVAAFAGIAAIHRSIDAAQANQAVFRSLITGRFVMFIACSPAWTNRY